MAAKLPKHRRFLAAIGEFAYVLGMFVLRVSFPIAAFLALIFGTAVAADEMPEYPVESHAMIEATDAFFDRVEARAKPRAPKPVIGLPLSVTRSRVVQDGDKEADILNRMGPVDHLTGYRITWYPLDDGLHGTVDFIGTWNRNRNLVCGYLTWNMTDPRAPVLETVSASFVDLAALRGSAARDTHESLLEANCAYGAVEKNYRLFDVSG